MISAPRLSTEFLRPRGPGLSSAADEDDIPGCEDDAGAGRHRSPGQDIAARFPAVNEFATDGREIEIGMDGGAVAEQAVFRPDALGESRVRGPDPRLHQAVGDDLVLESVRGERAFIGQRPLSEPVPEKCVLEIASGTNLCRDVPVYDCNGAGPYVARLGLGFGDSDWYFPIHVGWYYSAGTSVRVVNSVQIEQLYSA